MIKIIAKGYKYLLTQIDDFLGSARTIVISLKSIKGRKEYEQLFGRKLDDQKTNIKIRIISLKQSRLTDIISNLFEKSMSRYSIFDPMLSKYSNLKILFIEKIKRLLQEGYLAHQLLLLRDYHGPGDVEGHANDKEA